MHQRVKMLASRTLADDGSTTTLLVDNYYLLPVELAEALVAEGAAEPADGWEG